MASKNKAEEMEEVVAEKFGIPPEGRHLTKIHKYKGVTFSGFTPKEFLEVIPDVEIREDDILIASYPKSGTHWIWETALLILANGDKEEIDRGSMIATPLEFVCIPDINAPTYKVFEQAKSPRVVLTHLPWQFLPKQVTEQKKGKILYIVRNPKDIIASASRFFHAQSGEEKDEKMWQFILKNFCEGELSSGDWHDHVSGYLKHKENENVFITTYEEMKLNFSSVAESMAKFLGKDLDEEALRKVTEHATVKGMKKSYDDIEKNQPKGAFITKAMGNNSFIRKGVIGSWKNMFTVADNEMFEREYGEKVASLDLDIIYEA